MKRAQVVSNPYLAYLEEDPQLYSAIEVALPALRELAPLQVEKLVFYLKSLHAHYPKSENHVAYLEQFSKRLDTLRNSEEQSNLQRRSTASIFKGVALCLVSGLLLAIMGVLFLGSQYLPASLAAVAAFTLVVVAITKFFRGSILISKEQDRKYFLACVRSASACDELDWSGLFTYHRATKSGSHSDEDLRQVHAAIGELTASLRAALYNDEFFQYSDPKLSERPAGDA
jgi:hypothetical protein